jgi:tetratricopeptide (TPR) repeat protein
VGRELGVRYVLEGSVDRLGDEVRLSLQLVSADSGQALWAERFNGELRDLSALHRRITGTIAQSLQVRLVEAESARALRQPAANVDAQDLALQAWSLLRRNSPDEVKNARELLLRAVARDPQSAFAWSLLADTYTADVGSRSMQRRGATREEWLQRALDAANRAYALNPNYLPALNARAFALSLQGRADLALEMIERQLALNRNDAAAWFRLSYVYATLGRAEDAIKAGHEAIRLSPRDANLCGFYIVIAAAHLHLGHDAQALEWARKSALERPDFSVAHSWIASAAANAGDFRTAHAALTEFRRLQPDYTVNSFRAENLCANPLCRSQRERYLEGLKKAGLPE